MKRERIEPPALGMKRDLYGVKKLMKKRRSVPATTLVSRSRNRVRWTR